MNKVPTVSIGIPAYNEALNIEKLLKSLSSQVGTGFRISDIIVVSDGSTDSTVQIVNEIRSNVVKIIAGSSRLGKSARINQIIQEFKGDTLLLVDADVIIEDKYIISKIINSGNIKENGLISVNAMPYQPTNNFQKIMEYGTLLAKDISANWNKGKNYLSFRGCFLAIDRRLAKSINIDSKIVNNDAYIYLSALNKGYNPIYLDTAVVYFVSPKNFADYLKQSSRYKNSKKEMQKYFNTDLKNEYKIPSLIMIKSLSKYMLSNPLKFLSYFSLYVMTQYKKEKNIRSTWNIAMSTKN